MPVISTTDNVGMKPVARAAVLRLCAEIVRRRNHRHLRALPRLEIFELA
jgi:hypothetical protein